jgi:propanol-preferring alcohol dehydrogenase
MHAAVVEQFGKPLVLRDWDVPTPGPGQVVLRTLACGVCHTDLHAAHGDWPLKPTLPFIPGHEAVGNVSAVGSGVTIVKEGDRVGVPWLYSACGHCEYCLAAWETVCPEAQFGGYTKNGGFAEYVLADPNYVAHIPKGLATAEAAPLICAGITTYKGIKETEARPGEWLVISGVGGLGHLAIQYAIAMGLRTCAVDIDDGKLAHAKRLGADLVVNAKSGDPTAAVKKGTDGGGHGVLITAPSLGAFKQGVGMTR